MPQTDITTTCRAASYANGWWNPAAAATYDTIPNVDYGVFGLGSYYVVKFTVPSASTSVVGLSINTWMHDPASAGRASKIQYLMAKTGKGVNGTVSYPAAGDIIGSIQTTPAAYSLSWNGNVSVLIETPWFNLTGGATYYMWFLKGLVGSTEVKLGVNNYGTTKTPYVKVNYETGAYAYIRHPSTGAPVRGQIYVRNASTGAAVPAKEVYVNVSGAIKKGF